MVEVQEDPAKNERFTRASLNLTTTLQPCNPVTSQKTTKSPPNLLPTQSNSLKNEAVTYPFHFGLPLAGRCFLQRFLAGCYAFGCIE